MSLSVSEDEEEYRSVFSGLFSVAIKAILIAVAIDKVRIMATNDNVNINMFK